MKRVAIGIGILLLAALTWYIFLKPFDYLVTFRARAIPGTINQSIKTWSSTLDSAVVFPGEDLSELTQELHFGDSTHIYSWKVTALTDSTSKVKVYARDKLNSFRNKIAIPFSDTNFEKRTRKTLLEFNEKLSDHINSFKVNIVGKERLQATFCACVTVKCTQIEKAKGMMRNYPLLNSIFADHGIPLNGSPFIEVKAWDKSTDSLQYDFCYPLIRTENLPAHPEITYRNFSPENTIKAIYNGNYITSDRAWYALLSYAEENGIEVSGLPIEIFSSNPNLGGNELEWTAEIFMPITEKDE